MQSELKPRVPQGIMEMNAGTESKAGLRSVAEARIRTRCSGLHIFLRLSPRLEKVKSDVSRVALLQLVTLRHWVVPMVRQSCVSASVCTRKTTAWISDIYLLWLEQNIIIALIFFSAAGREIARLHIAWPNFFIYSITNIYTSVVASASQCSFFLRIPRATGGSLLERAWLHMGWMFVTKRGMVEWNWKYGRHTPSWSAEGIHRPVRICHDLWKVSEFGWMDVLDLELNYVSVETDCTVSGNKTRSVTAFLYVQ